MTNRLPQVFSWEAIMTSVEEQVSQDLFQTWLAGMVFLREEETEIVLGAPNFFSVIFIEDNFLSVIEQSIFAHTSLRKKVVFEVCEQKEIAEAESEPAKVSLAEDRGLSSPVGRDRFSTRKKVPVPQLNPRNTFENFVVGSDNQMAHATCMAVASAPGQAFNPLFIYGATGLGKTHLMQAVAHQIITTNPEAHVEYLSCEKFTNEYISAIKDNSLAQFRRRYRGVDVLLIDDIQFIAGKERTQEEFFHTFNDLFEAQKQILISCDRPVGEISKLEDRLVSRFQWGMVADIQPPDFETRVAILTQKAQSLNAFISEDILHFLAKRVSRNVRRMEGALTRVASFANMTKDPLDLACAERLLQDLLIEEDQRQISLEDIKKQVVEYYRLRAEDMESKRRPAKIALPRQIAMFISRLLTSHSLHEIGESFGGRDHGTVIHACKTVENIMEQDATVKRSVDYLINQLNKSF